MFKERWYGSVGMAGRLLNLSFDMGLYLWTGVVLVSRNDLIVTLNLSVLFCRIIIYFDR